MIRSFLLASAVFAPIALHAAEAAQSAPRYPAPPAFNPAKLQTPQRATAAPCSSPVSTAAGETPMGDHGMSQSFQGQSPSNDGRSPEQTSQPVFRGSPVQALPVVAAAAAAASSSATRKEYFTDAALKAPREVTLARRAQIAKHQELHGTLPEHLVCPILKKIYFTEFYLDAQTLQYRSPAYSPTQTPTAKKQDMSFPQAVAVAVVQQTLNDVVQAETAQQDTSELARATRPVRDSKAYEARRDLVKELELLQNDYIPGIAYCNKTGEFFDTETFETIAPADMHMSLTKKQ